MRVESDARLLALAGARTGWPWLPAATPEWSAAQPPPRISVVIPVLNQGTFLETAIRSVLLQGYPDVEILLIDGGSSDGSMDFTRTYAPWIAHVESMPDRGQAHAINKGMSRATGVLRAWLNADDFYLPGALHAIASAWLAEEVDVISGHTRFRGPAGEDEGRFAAAPVSPVDILRARGFAPPQQSTFWTAACWNRHGPLSEDLHYVMDQEFWLRMGVGGERWRLLDRDVAVLQHHAAQKTAGLSANPALLEERRRFIARFARSAAATPALRRDARRGLDAIWVKEWKLRQRDCRSRARYVATWLRALATNRRCLRVRAFYGALLAALVRPPGEAA